VKHASFKETAESFNFAGSIYTFSYISKDIVHQREIIKAKDHPKWIIKDTLINKPVDLSMKQLWHLPLKHFPINWKSINEKNERINPEIKEGYVSELYGKKELCEMMVFETNSNHITTQFEIDSI
jgi:hypothetical protein